MSDTTKKESMAAFEIDRNADGLCIKIKSPKIESLFKSLARDNRIMAALSNVQFEVWNNGDHSEKFIRNISDMFTNQAASLTRGRSNVKDEDVLVPTFRSTSIFQNNSVGVNLLMARGLSEGRTFQIAGMYSTETTKKIGLAFKKAMEYLINEAAKPCSYIFEIYERDSGTEESQVLEFPTR